MQRNKPRKGRTDGRRTYEYAPYEKKVSLNIYTETKNRKGDIVRRKTKRTLDLREIRIVRDDGRTFQNCIRTSAFNIESKLVDMLDGIYKNVHKDGHSLIAAALKTSGAIRLDNDRVVIRLLPQSSPTRTRAINQLLLQLNHMQARIPGSNRIIYFEQTPEPIPVLHNI